MLTGIFWMWTAGAAADQSTAAPAALHEQSTAALREQSTAAPAALSEPSPPRVLPLSGFALDLSPRFDDVFPDSIEYHRLIDRYFDLTGSMRGVCDDFARAVQEALSDVDAHRLTSRRANSALPDPPGVALPDPGAAFAAQGSDGGRRACSLSVARAYSRAQSLGQQYLRIGRELARHHDRVRELDRLGDSAGLTPDYRTRVKGVLSSYEALLGDYREMKATFHDQLTDELRFAGCDPAQLLKQAEKPGPAEVPEDPKALAAVKPPTADPANAMFSTEFSPGPPAGVAVATRTSLSGLGLSRPAESDAASQSDAAAQGFPDPHPRNSIQFHVDSTRCRRGHQVFLDGVPVGEVEGTSRASFRSTTGPHELCLISHEPAAPSRAVSPEAPPDAGKPAVVASAEHPVAGSQCGDPGTVRRSYLHEGWTIALRCE